MNITEEDFAEWRNHPITVRLLQFAGDKAKEMQATWLGASWNIALSEVEKIDTTRLAYLRGKHENYVSLCNLSFKDLYPKEAKEQKANGKKESSRGG